MSWKFKAWRKDAKEKMYRYLAKKAKNTLLYYMVIRAWNLYMAEFPGLSPWEVTWEDVTKWLREKK